jgi:cell division protein FtsB
VEEAGTTARSFVSIDGEEYVPRRTLDELRAERDRLAAEVERLRDALNDAKGQDD